MKQVYIKFLFNTDTIICPFYDRDKYVSRVKIDGPCPEGYLPQVRIYENPPLPWPTEPGIVRCFKYTLAGDHVNKEYLNLPVADTETISYKKSYLSQWLAMNGFWETFKAIIAQANEMTQVFWETSTEFDADHTDWLNTLAAIVGYLGLTNDQKDEMLFYGRYGKLPETEE